ncbi:MAG: hypothetical protein L3K17_09865 [Thermoplasmata archaeon]|nr:hypothetical protein [Thermoplasmata archaeon]
MSDPWNEAVGVTSVFSAAAYAYVAYRLSQRQVAPAAVLASRQFTLWWAGLSGTAVLGGAAVLLATLGWLTLPVAETAEFVIVLLDCAILWGLVGYLTYVYTGRYYLVPLSAFYAVFYVAVLYFEISEVPIGAHIQAGSLTLTYAHPVVLGPLVDFVVFGLLVPEFAGAFAYLSLLRSTRDPAQRYRITLVSLSILLWFSAALFIPSSPASWGLVKGLLEAGSALLTLAAYSPPHWVRERLSSSVAGAGGPDAQRVATTP